MIIVAIYFIEDPFKVLYHYDAYAAPDAIAPVNLNDDFVATEVFLNNYKKYNYDSYIFGNSRAKTFHINEWERHISSANCFQYAVSNESLYGVEKKIELLDAHGIVMKNALIVMDHFLYEQVEESPAYPKHPILSGKSMVQFQINTFEGYFDKNFLIPYICYLFNHKTENASFPGALNNIRYRYDARANDAIPVGIDSNIDSDTAAYYNERKRLFYQRDAVQKYETKTIGRKQIALMINIKAYFDKCKTNYKIVISPMYDQLKTDPTDLAVLTSIFGRNNVYDLSGINDITSDKHNYYEAAHYRMRISNAIMDSIYRQ